ncbi:methyltransferase domain-containing protein [Marinobacter orientalis]|uniref:Small RNA 2'-O-methyltransferase n=1 Tax=Marinobacter orientalis TaxID=1928859 RepID=A0A7Y0RB55_9GAMM|nr:methyltransferase domain-containing protein [Marinobacter orientalis]NMT62371.1 methyltransferase domain-containing protein [Marinobacter orientalis]TGX51076.1 methyltransferase domain-containing protein [Marinobacter orientalis]
MYEPMGSDENTMTQMTSLHEERLDFVFRTIKATGARRVLDLGCGSGSLLYRLLADDQFDVVTGLEDSGVSLRQARSVLAHYLDDDPARAHLIRGSYAESNPALAGYEAAAMVETIEHVRPEQLSRVERAVFGEYRPGCLFMTTPNREYNPLFDLAPGEFREEDHKFEWDRLKFQRWARGVADRNGYEVRFGGIGEFVPDVGHPTQTAFFTRRD